MKRAGGPKLEALLLTESQLKADLVGMEFVILHEIERDVREGDRSKNHSMNTESLFVSGILHTGHAAVIQCVAVVKSG